MSATRKTTLQRVLFAIAALLAVITIGSLPFAFYSVVKDIRNPGEAAVPFTPPDVQPAATYNRLEVTVAAVDEVNHTATLRVNGYHYCATDCGAYTDKVVFYQVDEDDSHQDSLPSSDSVTLPNSAAEVSAKLTLPLRGNVLTYPFDKYNLGLGVVIERIAADKTVKVLSPAETRGQLLMTVDEQVARMDMTQLKALDPKSVKPKKAPFDYAYVQMLHFERPVFLKLVVSMVVLLTVAVAIYTMITRPFDQLVINAGAIILGVFGARSLVLSGFPADVTLVDTVFALVVLYNLLALTIRGMNYFHRRGQLALLPWARSEPEKAPDPKPAQPEMRECPECLSKVPVAARRCAYCTSALEPVVLAVHANGGSVAPV